MTIDVAAARAWLADNLAEPIEIADDEVLDRAAVLVRDANPVRQAPDENAA